MAFNFKNFIIGNLPYYIIANDSYKDSEGKGLLERYLGVFSDYIDEDIYPQIKDYLNVIDASICDEKFLNHLSDVLGNPPDIFKNEQQYRNLLSYIVSVYKIKGTRDAYELFFSIIGFKIEIEEIQPDLETFIYDGEGLYDNPIEYDNGRCQACSTYNIQFFPLLGDGSALNLNDIILLQAAIDFNEPINANLNTFTYILEVEDNMYITITDTDELIGTIPELYDTGEIYDEDSTPINSSSPLKASSSNPSSITEI
jgi:phage tail-like protein